MKKQKKYTRTRILAATLAVWLVVLITAVPAVALDIGGMNGGRTGGTVGEGIESAVDDVTDGIDSVVDDITDIPNGTGTTDSGMNDTESGEGILGDESLEDGTNIPDSDIGGAVEDNDSDGISDPVDSDDDNDGVLDSADTDANGDGQDDGTKTGGIIGIIVAIIIVIAIVILVIAVMPRGKNKR